MADGVIVRKIFARKTTANERDSDARYFVEIVSVSESKS